jgi:hypothetical protein
MTSNEAHLAEDFDLEARIARDVLISLSVGEHDIAYLLSLIRELAAPKPPGAEASLLAQTLETLVNRGDAELGTFEPTAWDADGKADAWTWRPRKGTGNEIARFMVAEVRRPQNLADRGQPLSGAIGYVRLTDKGRASAERAFAHRGGGRRAARQQRAPHVTLHDAD